MNTRLECGASNAPRAATWAATLALLAACGGGGTPSQDEQAGPSIPQTGNPCATGAIEGGGRNKLAGVVSAVGSDGSVVVSNVRFTAATAQVYVDGERATIANLRTGDVASVTGTVDLSTQTGCAAEISADAVITAAIDTVDPTPQSSAIVGSLTILGQVVHISGSTVFGSDVQPPQLSSLQPGDIIRLTGLYKDVGVIEATRIDRAVGNYVVTGSVTMLDAANKTFLINDSIRVDYSGAGLIGFQAGDPRNGDPVRVTGTAFAAGNTSEPGSTVLQPSYVWYSQHGTTFTVFPADWTMNRGEIAQFTASSGPGSVTWSIVLSDGRACTPDTCGVINPATGAYNASIFGNDTRFFVVATSIADPTDRVSVPVYVTSQQAVFETGPHTVEGDLFAFDTGPVPGGEVSMWVRTATKAFSWFNVWPDEHGHFVAPHLPDSLIHVTAVKEGYMQPCAVRADVRGDVTVRVEMMPVSSFDAIDAPRPQLSAAPTLSGMIYETTASGRQPVSGVMIGVHLDLWDNIVAYTMSDRGGGYFLCNLGPPVEITVFKPGYVERQFVQLDTSQSQVLDIELERSPAGP